MNKWILLGLITFMGVMSPLQASKSFDYGLQPVEIAKNTWMFEGAQENFNTTNGGNIANTAFIVTTDGVIIIDSGPSRRYAEQQRAAIAKITNKPIIKVILTHHHPDHFLGNQVYMDTEIVALPDTISDMKQLGDMYASNMYRLAGDWMRGTTSLPARKPLKTGVVNIGGHKLEMMKLPGHTSADLVILDHTSGVLFAGDVVFHNRAATTPHAQLSSWRASLEKLASLPFKTLLPGHGPVANDTTPIQQTADYLQWLETTFQQAAVSGMDMNELMRVKIPERFNELSLLREELQRSVAHLYPDFEKAMLRPVN